MKSSLPEADRHDPVRTGSHTGMIIYCEIPSRFLRHGTGYGH
ncbi:hypothetical protein [Algoriphagus persicinus]|nr:hypothetical protein [Algoriphagus sp. E1-3-M2]MEB2787012.1 hypothetical protein [Algoriphagus sp. E1-3-M2]